MSKRTAILAIGVIMPALVAAAVAWLSIYRLRQYGLVLFVGTPLVLGFMSTAIIRFAGKQRFAICADLAGLSGFLLLLGFLGTGSEGLICILMALPLGLPLVLIGVVAAYLMFHRARRPPAPAIGVLLLVMAVAAVGESRVQRRAPRFQRSDSLIMNASPSEAWRAILTTESLPVPDDWFLRTGVACPRSARIVKAGAGGERVCTLSTGEYVEAIEIWEPEKRIRWRALSTPPPLKEVNPFHSEISPPHLQGFYEADAGEILIERIGASTVNVTRKTWYRHNLYPVVYWKQWCDFGAARAHQFVLREWKAAAERGRG
jgi:hypothetical protein